MTTGADEQTDRDPHMGKILLLGDMKRAFRDVRQVNGSRFEVCAAVDDALEAVAKKNFAAIAVVISSSFPMTDGMLTSSTRVFERLTRPPRRFGARR